MQVEKDLRNAIDLINGYQVDKREYRSVKIFTDFSLKHFKKYKLDDRQILLKLKSYDEVADLVSYGANVTCFSTNRFDEYFLNLFLSTLNLSYKEHFSYFKNDYTHKNKMFSYEIYLKIKENLSDDVRYFFDELYKKIGKKGLLNSDLVHITEYSYNQLLMYIRYFLESKYYKTSQNLKQRKIQYMYMSDDEVLSTFKEGSFDFINLSYNLDKVDNEKRKKIDEKIKQFYKLLKNNGKIQGFVSRNSEIILPEYRKIETRSLIDPNTNNNDCKKDYAYVYNKTNNIDKK